MASMREIKLRIRSVKETKQITKAMNLISASKLKKARQLRSQTLPYFDKVRTTMVDILTRSANIDSQFINNKEAKEILEEKETKEVKRKAYFVITGDKSLAGGYNHNIIKFAEDNIAGNKEALLFIAGVIGKNHFTKEKYNVVQDFEYIVQNPTVYRAREIAGLLIGLYSNKKIDEVYMIYTAMESSIKLQPHIMKVLPLDLEDLKLDTGSNLGDSNKYEDSIIYEPSPKVVFDILVQKYVKGIVYGALTEAFTSEQCARMTAMDNATSNADEILHKLNLFYNRARQAAITQEISEIVGGAEAMK